jgi:phenylacetic acid degradation operon negative regulatory protein
VTQPRNTRQLNARSVIASTLLGTQPPRLPGRALVQVAGLFGISDGTARVALSRMVAAGELAAQDGSYRLAGPRLLQRQARQSLSRQAPTQWWRGEWRQAIVTADRRRAADRAELRHALQGARLAELREGVWLRPDNLEIDWAPVVTEQCTVMRVTEAEPGLSALLWDLDGWAGQARQLRRDIKALVGPLERGRSEKLADGFVVSAAVLRHFQADPLLPDELLPARWPGPALRAEYDRFDVAYRAVLRHWLRILRANG